MSLEAYFRENVLDDGGAAVSHRMLLATPVLSFRAAAERAGWSRDADREETPCFMNEHGVHEYRYATTWTELCKIEGIAPERVAPAGISVISLDLAERLEMNGERVVEVDGAHVWVRISDQEPADRFAEEPAFESAPSIAPAP